MKSQCDGSSRIPRRVTVLIRVLTCSRKGRVEEHVHTAGKNWHERKEGGERGGSAFNFAPDTFLVDSLDPGSGRRRNPASEEQDLREESSSRVHRTSIEARSRLVVWSILWQRSRYAHFEFSIADA